MIQEAIAWGTTPTLTDAEDPGQSYNMGAAFTASVVRDCVGIQVYATDTVPTPGGGVFAIALWNETTGIRLAVKTVTPVAGAGLTTFLFDAPVTLNLTDTYVAAYYTFHYAFRAGSPSGLTNPSGGVTLAGGRLTPYNGGYNLAPIPGGSFASTYYIGPVVEVAGATTPVTSSLTGKWRVYNKVTSSLTGKWRVYAKVSSILTAKWRVYAKVSSPITIKWRVYGKVQSLLTSKWRVYLSMGSSTLTGKWRNYTQVVSRLTAKWTNYGAPAPEPVVSTAYLTAQRAATVAYINDDPTTLVLVPRSRQATPSGGFTYVDGAPRPAQTVKMILLNSDQRPRVMVAGVERLIDYHMLGRWDMLVAVGDTWEAEDGTTWEIVGFSEGWDYMTKAHVSRVVPRGGKP